jgi:hypothetical protein
MNRKGVPVLFLKSPCFDSNYMRCLYLEDPNENLGVSRLLGTKTEIDMSPKQRQEKM